MAKKAAAKKTKRKTSLGMIGGVNEGSLSRVNKQISLVSNSLAQLKAEIAAIKDKNIKAAKRQVVKIRTKQLRNLVKSLNALSK